jgi:hypothetical protein
MPPMLVTDAGIARAVSAWWRQCRGKLTHVQRLRSRGWADDDIEQEAQLAALARHRGAAPFDPRRGRLSAWVSVVCTGWLRDLADRRAEELGDWQDAGHHGEDLPEVTWGWRPPGAAVGAVTARRRARLARLAGGAPGEAQCEPAETPREPLS